MTVNFEIKGMLAKLLSTEDIIVENKKVDTACFNVETRVLTLPLWEKASDNIYTMLVLHEISHARWTPNIDWSKEHKVPGQYVNIVEDVRVEKLCKKKYLGSSKSFFNGYKELQEQDFFCIGEDDHNTYSLADRVNLHFKVGNFVDVEFNEEEQEIVNLISSAETFDDALNAAKVLYEYCKKEKEQQENVDVNLNQTNNPAGNSSESSDSPQTEEGENDAEESSEQQQTQGNQSPDLQDKSEGGKTSSMSNKEEPEVKTVDKLSESIRELAGNNSFSENVYVEIPKVNLNKIIVPNSDIHKVCDDFWVNFIERKECTQDQIFGVVDSDFNKFKKSSQKEVNYLVKEFECRKAADSYSRATTARTGILDCSKLHTYMFNDDMFLKVTTLAEGKNHGLVFILDWSGSMSNVMMDTIKQLYNLIWFCRKVSIPFEVYAFTNSYPRVRYDDNGKSQLLTDSYERLDGTLCVEEWFSLMNLLTSKVNNNVLDRQMKNIYRIAHSFKNHYCNYEVPSHFHLSGTPLNDAIYSLHQILPKFKSENKLQKVQCVILTDGEGNSPQRNCMIRNDGREPYIGTRYIGGNTYLRDRKTGFTYRLDRPDMSTDVFLQNLRDKFTDMNFIGIRILESRDAGYFIRKYYGYHGNEYEKINSTWKKEKSFVIKKSGYHSYFALSSSILGNDAEFEVADDATKTQIKTAFAKSLKNKKMNKKILGEFISLVA